MRFGSPHRHFARTDSTNTRARELAAAGAPHGTVVTAAEQSAGRGRQGRTWTSPPGRALLYSAVVRPGRDRQELLPLSAAVAVAETAEELAPGTRCELKWPNDVLAGGRKLAGILIEARPNEGWAVVGVGLNLTTAAEEFPPELRQSATSLAIEAGGGPSKTPGGAAGVLSALLGHWLSATGAEVLAAWRERDALRGREVAWDGGSGVAAGIDDSGHLVVVTAAGRVAVGAGEVHLTSF